MLPIILAILGLILGGAIFMTIIVQYFTFIYLFIENKLGIIEKPSEYIEIPTKNFIKNYIKEYVLVMSKFFLLPYKHINISANVTTNCDHAILLVHGFSRSQTDWLWFIKKLSKQTTLPIFATNIIPNKAPIQQLAISLETKIQEIKSLTACKKIILIGHSMGGLISSYYSEFMDNNDEVKTVITIGTPFHGTKIAVAAHGANMQQMQPNNQFLLKLCTSIATSKKKYFNIATQMDNLVFPWQSCLLENNAENQKVFQHQSHLGLIFSKHVIQQIHQWIATILKP